MRFSISIDKLVILLAGLAVAVLPVLINDGVISSKLGADIGTAVATYVVGYHTKQGMVLGGGSSDPAPAELPATDPAAPTDPSASGMGQEQAGPAA